MRLCIASQGVGGCMGEGGGEVYVCMYVAGSVRVCPRVFVLLRGGMTGAGRI